MAGPTPTVLQVFIFKDGDFIGTDVFVEREVIIGRDGASADLVLDSTQVSRRHARLTVDKGERIRLQDLQSTNGVFVNDEEVSQAEITRLDEVSIGEFSLKFKLVRNPAAKPKPKARATQPVQPMSGGETIQHSRLEDSAAGTAATDQERRRKLAARKGANPSKKTDAAFNKSAEQKQAKLAQQKQAKLAQQKQAKLAQQKAESATQQRQAVAAKKKAEAEKAQRAQSSAQRRGQSTTNLDGPSDWDPFSNDGTPLHTPSPPMEDSAPHFDFPDDDLDANDFAPTEIGTNLADMATAAGGAEGEFLGHPAAEQNEENAGPGRGQGTRGAEHFADDPEDDEDATWTPAFSLTRQLVEEDKVVAEPRGTAFEVLTLLGDSVVSAETLRPGRSLWIGQRRGLFGRAKARDLPRRLRLFRMSRRGVQVQFDSNAKGTLKRGQEKSELKATVTRRRGGLATATLQPGDIVDIKIGAHHYHGRYILPPEAIPSPPVSERLAPSDLLIRSGTGSLGLHAAFGIFIALWVLFAPAPSQSISQQQFIELTLVEPEPEEPEPPAPEPEPVVEPEPEPEPEPKRQPKPKKQPRVRPAVSSKPQKAEGTEKKPSGILGLLKNRKSSALAPGKRSALAAVSNLSSTKTPKGTSGFRTTGLVGKLPTSSLSLGGGGGGPMTKGIAALGGGSGKLRGSGKRSVSATVKRVPRSMRSAGQGTLDRDQIQKVINKNISQIQRCYERELLRSAGLAGKVQVEWTISTSGSVRVARQKSSTLKSSAVVNCILGRIRGWKFPKPRGGEVLVNYPFIFQSIGF